MPSTPHADTNLTQLAALLDADRRRAYPSGNSTVISPPQIEEGEEYVIIDSDVDLPDAVEQFCVSQIYRWPSVSEI